MYSSMDLHRFPAPGKYDSPAPMPPERELDLELEIQAWVELLLDFYDYKRRRNIDADGGQFNMEVKVDS
jgi:hypothetical protein